MSHQPNAYDVEAIRRDFPILSEKVRGRKDLVYLDNAATVHKPYAVVWCRFPFLFSGKRQYSSCSPLVESGCNRTL